MKLLQKLSFGIIAASCMVITFIKPVLADTVFDYGKAVNKANTLTLSNLSDEELLEYLRDVNDFSKIIDSGIYIREISTAYEDIHSDMVLGPNGYQTCFTTTYNFGVDSINAYGYRPYSPDVKSVIVFDEQLRQWTEDHQSFRNDNFELEEGETITARREQDGILYLSTVLPYIGGFDGLFADLKAEPIPHGTLIYFESKFDIATGVLLSNQAFKEKDGQLVNVYYRVYEYHKEAPLVDKVNALHEDSFGGKTHTIGIIVGQGTEREKVYITTANESAFLDVWIRDVNGKYSVYLDPEYTIECPQTEYGYIPFDSDKVLYMK